MNGITLSIISACSSAPTAPSSLLHWLKQQNLNFELICVVDQENSAADNGAEAIKYVTRRRPGYGGALRDGLAQALGEFVITIDNLPELSLGIVEKLWLAKDSADIVSAVERSLANAKQPFLVSLLNLPIQEIASPFRIYKRKALLDRKAQSEDRSILPELLVRAFADGFSVAEVDCPEMSRGATKQASFSLKTMYQLWVLRNSVESADYDERAHRSKIPLQRYWQRKRHNIISNYLAPIKRDDAAPALQILDIGCGSSRIIQGLERAVAFDYAFRKLRYLRKTNKYRVWGSTFALPFEANSFDQVIHSQVIEHIPYEPIIYSELNRVMRTGGTLVIGTPDYGRIWWPIIEYFYGKILPNAYADEHITHYTRPTLVDILAEFGFKTLSYSYICGGELIIKAQKISEPAPDAENRAPHPRKRPPLV